MNRAAFIYIGPNTCEFLSLKREANHKISTIDQATYPTDIGFEIAQKGHITIRMSKRIKQVINEYLRLASESDPEEVVVLLSNELQTADNFLIFYESLKTDKEDVIFKVLTSEEEMMVFCTTSYLAETKNEKNVMMAAINSTNIKFALTNEQLIDYIEEIPYGYLRLAQLIGTIIKERTRYSKLLSEIIASKLRLAIEHIGERKLDLVSLITKDAQAIASIYEHEKRGEAFYFKKETIEKAYQELKELITEQIQHLYPSLTEPQALTIQSTIILARQLIRAGSVDSILLIQKDVIGTISKLSLNQTKKKEVNKWINNSSYQSAIEVSKRYNVDQKHADEVETFALRIYNALKKRFGFTGETKRLLRLATRLLDVGQYGGEEGQSKANEEIILREHIIGLTTEQERALARICKNVKINSYDKTLDSEGLDLEDQILVLQLTAILKTAVTLDQSRRHKISKISCSLDDTKLHIKITTTHNTQLESYYFNRDKIWMKRIFEIEPVLHVKRVKV